VEDFDLFCFQEYAMNFKTMCENYIEMSREIETIPARRKIWPGNVHLLLGVVTNGSPAAVVKSDYSGRLEIPIYLRFGMNLIMDREMIVFGWCPSIDDVMGQDWEFIERR
jgi:hypothetical protein